MRPEERTYHWTREANLVITSRQMHLLLKAAQIDGYERGYVNGYEQGYKNGRDGEIKLRQLHDRDSS